MVKLGGDREYDVCLSFAAEQRAYVEKVARLLQGRGVRVFYDTDERERLWGEDLYTYLDWIYQHGATFCVMFISADYLRRLWTNHERRSVQARVFRESAAYVLPARFDDTEIPGLRPTVGHIDLRMTSPEELTNLILAKLTLAMENVATQNGQVRPESPAERRPYPTVVNANDSTPGATIIPPVGRLPPAGLRGREAVLGALQRATTRRSRRVQVLAGIGGVGKSATALAFCVKAGPRRWRRGRVWWISAADEESLTAGMVGLARRLGGSEQDLRLIAEAAPEAPERVWALLARAPRGWRLVVDNADDPQLLAAPTPRGSTASASVADGTGWIRASRQGQVVVTSRIADPQVWGVRFSDVHRLRVLGVDEATEVLLDLVRQNRRESARTGLRPPATPTSGEVSAARELSIALGGLPLALHLAGSAIASPYSSWVTISEYLQSFKASGVGLLTPAPDTPLASDPRTTVMRTWELTLDALAARQLPQARPLLRLLSCFAAAVPIPADLVDLERLADLLPNPATGPRSENLASAQTNLRRCHDGLARTGLIDLIPLPEANGKGSAIVIHPLIVETNRSHLISPATDEGAAHTICRTAVVLLAKAATQLPADNTKNWAALRLLVPHLHAVLDFAAHHMPAADTTTLLSATAQLVNFHEWAGADVAGERLARLALSFAAQLGPDEAAVADLHFQLAHTLGNRDRWQDAETEYRQVLDSRMRVLGAEHPRTLSVRHQLAWVMANRGRWQDAETEYRQVLDSRMRVLGAEHPRTLSARHQVAWVVGNLGRWHEAEAEYRQVLRSRIRILGPDHRDTLATRHRLAWVAGHQGRWEQAESEYRVVLDARLQVLGPDHRDTLATHDRLAWAVGNRNRWAEAEAGYRQVLASRLRILGPDHRDTVATRNQLAWVAGHQGQWEAADTAYRQVLASRLRLFGPEHPDTLTTRHQLAWLMANLGQWAEAESDGRQVLDCRARVLGAEHPHTLDTRYQLAWILSHRGLWDEATAQARKTLDSRLRILGPDHPDIFASRQQLNSLTSVAEDNEKPRQRPT